MKRIKITPQKLRRLYYAEHKSAVEVARELGVSSTTVRNYLNKFDWRVKNQSEIMKGRKLSKEHRDKIIGNLRGVKL